MFCHGKIENKSLEKAEYSRTFKKMRANREAKRCNWNDMEDVRGNDQEGMRQGLRQDDRRDQDRMRHILREDEGGVYKG